MAYRIVLIQGHPDPSPNRLCRALADAYADGAMAAGHEVTRIDLAALDFPFLRTQQDFLHGAVPQALEPAKQAILRADHLVIVFPLWLGTMPALLKAFLEQVLRPGIAFTYDDRGMLKPHLKKCSARIVVTMGMPCLFYRWWFLSHALRGFRRNILKFAGLNPVRETLFGRVEAVEAYKRLGWIDQMRRLGTAGT